MDRWRGYSPFASDESLPQDAFDIPAASNAIRSYTIRRRFCCTAIVHIRVAIRIFELIELDSMYTIGDGDGNANPFIHVLAHVAINREYNVHKQCNAISGCEFILMLFVRETLCEIIPSLTLSNLVTYRHLCKNADGHTNRRQNRLEKEFPIINAV